MVIPEDRARLRKAIRALLVGRITTCQFDRFYFELKSSHDQAVAELAEFGYGLYHDGVGPYRLTEHYPIKSETQAIAERCLLFLRTDLEYSWPPPPTQFWQGAAWSLSFNALLPLSVALIIIALALLASALGNGKDFIFFFACGLLGCILLFSSIGLWRWSNRRDNPKWQEYWASGDREVWPFLNRAEYDQAVGRMNASATSSPATADPDRSPNHPI